MTTSASTVTVSSGQNVSGLVVEVNQTLVVQAGGVATSTQIDPTSAWAQVDDETTSTPTEAVYGSSIGTQINDGEQDVYANGHSLSAVVGEDGTLWVSGGGFASNSIVQNGGSLWLGNDEGNPTPQSGAASGTQVSVETGGQVYAGESATLAGGTIASGGIVMLTHNTTVASDITVQNGGVLLVESGASASHIHVDSGGFLFTKPGAVLGADTSATPGYLLTDDDNNVVSAGTSAYRLVFSNLPSGGDGFLDLLVTSGGRVENIEANTGQTGQITIEDYGTLDNVSNIVSTGYGGNVFLNIDSGGVLSGWVTGRSLSSNTWNPAVQIQTESGAILSGVTLTSSVQAFLGSGTVISGSLRLTDAAQIRGGVISHAQQLDVLDSVIANTTIEQCGYNSFANAVISNCVISNNSTFFLESEIGSNLQSAAFTSNTVTNTDINLDDSSTTLAYNHFYGSNTLVQTYTNVVCATNLHNNVYEDGATLMLGGAQAKTADDTFINAGGFSLTKSAHASRENLQNTSIFIADGAQVDSLVLSGATVTVTQSGSLSNTEITSGSTLAFGNGTLNNVSIDVGAILAPEYGTPGIQGDNLVFTDGTGATIASMHINGAGKGYQLAVWGEEDDGEFIVEDGTPCYCRGTLINTATGERPVETLAIGDKVATLHNGLRPIKWIGRRAYSGQFAAGNKDVLPVVIRAGALGQGLPEQDLSVSPLHAMYLNDVLVPAVQLVNGTSIVQAEAMDEVAYFHIELDSHDIIFANGAASETFVDDQSRGMFHNAADYAVLYPNAASTPARYCAPRLEEGRLLEQIRQRIMAGDAPTATTPLEGFIDTVSRTTISGWAYDPTNPNPVTLRILNKGVVLGDVLADAARPDVGRACGFSFDVPAGLSMQERHVIEVQRVTDATPLGHSPWVLDLAEQPVIRAITVTPPRTPLAGFVDCVSHDRISGWAYSPDTPDTPVALQVLDNGHLIANLVANAQRPDVQQSGACPTMRCGFTVLLPGILSPMTRHVIEVRREEDGALLGEPHVLAPATAFDATLEKTLAQAVSAAQGQPQQEDVLLFLMAQVERLKKAKAESQTGAEARQTAKARQRRGQAAPLPAPRKRALFIDTQTPDMNRDAGSCAILSHMRACMALGYDVSFVAADQMAVQPDKAALADIDVLGAPFYASVEDVLRRQAGCFDVVYLHRVTTATRYSPLVRQYMPRSRVLYSVADLHHVRLARQAQIQARPELLTQAKRVQTAEYAAMQQADAVLTHSTEEAALITRHAPRTTVHVVPWAFEPATGLLPSFTKRSGLVFVGNYTHAPNHDAARWLATEVMPCVWQKAPHIMCTLAGAAMPESLFALAQDRLRVVGHVPDLNTLYDTARLSVAPLRFGAGIKGKVLESFAAGLPCIMTAIAAEGLMLPSTLERLIGYDAQSVAERIVELHEREDLHHLAVQEGRSMIARHYTAQPVQAALAQALPPAHYQLQRTV